MGREVRKGRGLPASGTVSGTPAKIKYGARSPGRLLAPQTGRRLRPAGFRQAPGPACTPEGMRLQACAPDASTRRRSAAAWVFLVLIGPCATPCQPPCGGVVPFVRAGSALSGTGAGCLPLAPPALSGRRDLRDGARVGKARPPEPHRRSSRRAEITGSVGRTWASPIAGIWKPPAAFFRRPVIPGPCSGSPRRNAGRRSLGARSTPLSLAGRAPGAGSDANGVLPTVVNAFPVTGPFDGPRPFRFRRIDVGAPVLTSCCPPRCARHTCAPRGTERPGPRRKRVPPEPRPGGFEPPCADAFAGVRELDSRPCSGARPRRGELDYAGGAVGPSALDPVVGPSRSKMSSLHLADRR